MNNQLKENERIDELERNGYRIIQNRNKFCFGMDAVLLSGFAAEGELGRGKARLRAADLGTGTGIIPLLLYGRLRPALTCDQGGGETDGRDLLGKRPGGSSPAKGSSNIAAEHLCEEPAEHSCRRTVLQPREDSGETYGKQPEIEVTGLEIQEEMCDMARRSVQMNHLEQQISICHGDIRNAGKLLGTGCFDVVTSNPPYKKQGVGLPNPDSSKAISRHEILCTFQDVAEQAAGLLKQGGRFYLVHRPERLAELICTLKAAGLEPKRLRMVHSFQDSPASMVLIESTKGGGAFLKVEKPLVIYQEKGVYTEEILQIYGY